MSKFKVLGIFSFFFLLFFVLFILSLSSRSDQSAKDSDALFGGQIEKGYPSAGYLVINTPSGVKSCGYAVLSPTVAVTASHCVDDATSIFLGLGDFSYSSENKILAISAVQKSGWVNLKNRRDDFAILRFSSDGFFSDFADIERVEEGCKYRVVAYGRTENIEEYGRFPRKSARMCAFGIENDIFRIKADPSEKAGICFGDSGSPLYIDGTNKLVGVVVSILKNKDKQGDQCDFDNTAVVVRTDANISFVNQSFQLASNEIINRTLEYDDVLVQVVEQSLFSKLGLGFIDNLNDSQKVISFGLISFGVLLIIFAAYAIFSSKYKPI